MLPQVFPSAFFRQYQLLKYNFNNHKNLSYIIFKVVRITIDINTGLMNFAPLLITSSAPILDPIICPAAITIPAVKITYPPIANMKKETMLLVKFITLVYPVAFVRLYPSPATNAIAQMLPDPGPKNPS